MGTWPAWGVLLERHRAHMRAVAVSLLGWGPDADDAVQDAMLVALQRLGELRDPAAAGPWLKAITRNAARMRLRSASREAPRAGHASDPPSHDPGPEEILDRHSLRDWIWSALERLTGPLQLAILLRYFTDSGSYQQIAAVCGVPVGTIRSRLNQARAKLTDTLLESAAAAHDDTAALTARRQCEAENLISSAPRGEFREALAALTAPDLTLIGPQGQRTQGRDTLAHIMDSDLQAGVRQQPIRVTAAHHLTILECDLINPAWDPQHCPPAVLWVMTQPSERIEQIKLFHPTPPRRDPAGVIMQVLPAHKRPGCHTGTRQSGGI
jgi:RNA polymerase sigma factor (sigma-70 family)